MAFRSFTGSQWLLVCVVSLLFGLLAWLQQMGLVCMTVASKCAYTSTFMLDQKNINWSSLQQSPMEVVQCPLDETIRFYHLLTLKLINSKIEL